MPNFLSFLNPIGGLAGLAKLALVIGFAGTILVTGYKVYNYVKTSEQNKIIVVQQQEALKHNQEVIDQMHADQALRDQAVQDQQTTIDDLRQKLQGITNNLDKDSENQAPNSIKQTIDKLKALEIPNK